MQKLRLALDVYRGLGVIPATRADTLTKVMGMLLHPLANVHTVLVASRTMLTVKQIRITAAETLWFLTHEDGLKRHDWSLPSKTLKPAVDIIKTTLVTAKA
jgi:hypothetical protein